MQVVELQAKIRQKMGKGMARKLRRDKLIPAIVYGGEDKPLPITIDPRLLFRALSRENVIIKLSLEGDSTSRMVLLKELQRHPLRGDPLHADFLEISMEKAIRVAVPVQLVGEAAGVKMKGGILQQHLRELTVECLPMAIPDLIEVDVSSLDIGDALHVKDLRVGEGVKVLEDLGRTVVSVSAPQVVAEEVKAVPAEEAAKVAEAPEPARKKAAEEGA